MNSITPDDLAQPQRLIEIFNDNLTNDAFLKKYAGLPSWIHLSIPRVLKLLNKLNQGVFTEQKWNAYVVRHQNDVEANALMTIIDYGLSNNDDIVISESVTKLIVNLISIPTPRLYLEPLLDETLYLLRCADTPLLSVLDYYLSFKWEFGQGVLPYSVVIENYNKFFLDFQNWIFTNADPNSPIVTFTINDFANDENDNVDPLFYDCMMTIFEDDTIFSNLKDYFMINCNADRDLTIRALARLLQQPTNPLEAIPAVLMPHRLPPPGLLFPHFSRHALCLDDATLQVFHELRATTAEEVITFLDRVRSKLSSDREVRFSRHALPLIMPPVKSLDTNNDPTYTLMFDKLFLQFGFDPFKIGDLIYLISPDSILGCEVTRLLNDAAVAVKVMGDSEPNNTYKIIIKLPNHMSQKVRKIIELPTVLGKSDIPQPVADAFVGYALKSVTSPIVIVNHSHFEDVISEFSYSKGKRTIIFGTNSEVLDFVLKGIDQHHRSNGQVIPWTQFLRLDLKPEVCINRMLDARERLLSQIEQIEPGRGQSCATAWHFLQMYGKGHPTRQQLLDMIDLIRPLDYIEDTQKRMEYFKTKCDIVTHVISPNIQIDGKFDEMIVLDSNMVDDAEMLLMLKHVRPNKVMLFGKGKCAQRLSQLNAITKIDRKVANDRMTPGVVEKCHFWECPTDQISDSIIAGGLYFKLIGYKSVVLIVPDSKCRSEVMRKMKIYTSWLMALAMPVMTVKEFYKSGQIFEIVICATPEDVKVDENLVYWRFWNSGVREAPCEIVLDERAEEEVAGQRMKYQIQNVKHLKALVFSMQMQMAHAMGLQ